MEFWFVKCWILVMKTHNCKHTFPNLIWLLIKILEEIFWQFSIRSQCSHRLGSQMSRLRQVTRQMVIYLSTLSLGIKTSMLARITLQLGSFIFFFFNMTIKDTKLLFKMYNKMWRNLCELEACLIPCGRLRHKSPRLGGSQEGNWRAVNCCSFGNPSKK